MIAGGFWKMEIKMAWYAGFQDIEGSSNLSARDADALAFDKNSGIVADKATPKLLESSLEGTVYPREDDGSAEWAYGGMDTQRDGIADTARLPEFPVDDFLF